MRILSALFFAILLSLSTSTYSSASGLSHDEIARRISEGGHVPTAQYNKQQFHAEHESALAWMKQFKPDEKYDLFLVYSMQLADPDNPKEISIAVPGFWDHALKAYETAIGAGLYYNIDRRNALFQGPGGRMPGEINKYYQHIANLSAAYIRVMVEENQARGTVAAGIINNNNNNNNLEEVAPARQAASPRTKEQSFRDRFDLPANFSFNNVNLDKLPATFDPWQYLQANPEVADFAVQTGREPMYWAFHHASNMDQYGWRPMNMEEKAWKARRDAEPRAQRKAWGKQLERAFKEGFNQPPVQVAQPQAAAAQQEEDPLMALARAFGQLLKDPSVQMTQDSANRYFQKQEEK